MNNIYICKSSNPNTKSKRNNYKNHFSHETSSFDFNTMGQRGQQVKDILIVCLITNVKIVFNCY